MSRLIFKIKISEILTRVGRAIGSNKNEAIADALGVGPQTCSNWKKRNAIPWAKLFNFSQEYRLSFNWLLTGEEENQQTKCPTCGNWSDEVKEECRKLRNILESGDEDARNAIMSTLNMCWRSIETKGKSKAKKDLPEGQTEPQPQEMKKKQTSAR